MARSGPPEPPSIFIGSATIQAPIAGSSSSRVRFSRPGTLAAAVIRCTMKSRDWHHLVAVAPGAGVEAGGERALGHQSQGVGPPLLGRGALRRGRPLMETGVEKLLPRGVESPQQSRPGLGREPSPHHHHAVLVDVGGEVAAVVTPVLVLQGLEAVDPPQPPDDPLEMGGRAPPGQAQQLLLDLGGGDAGHRPYLGVGDLAPAQSLGDERQLGQRPRHPHPLPGGTEVGDRVAAIITHVFSAP
jgi:hypothetical protein